MAEGGDNMTFEQAAAQKPGIGMRMTISMIKTKFSNVANMSTEELGAKLNKTQTPNHSDGKLVLLDCRPEEEYNVSSIPGSIRVEDNWPQEQIIGMMKQAEDSKNIQEIVCYCSVGYRSCIVAEKLKQYYNGNTDQENSKYPAIFNLEGSLFKWANEGRKMVDLNGEPTHYAHPYNSIFGKLLDSKLRKSSLN